MPLVPQALPDEADDNRRNPPAQRRGAVAAITRIVRRDTRSASRQSARKRLARAQAFAQQESALLERTALTRALV